MRLRFGLAAMFSTLLCAASAWAGELPYDKAALDKAIADPAWARLVVQSSQSPAVFGHGIRAHLKADVAEAIAEGRVSIADPDLAADIVIGIWLQIARGTLDRRPAANLTDEALAALLRALGVPQ